MTGNRWHVRKESRGMAERLKQGLLGLSLIVLVGMALSGGGQELWAAEPDAWTLLFQ